MLVALALSAKSLYAHVARTGVPAFCRSRTFHSVVGTSIVEPKRNYHPVFASVQTAPAKYGECLSVCVCTLHLREVLIASQGDHVERIETHCLCYQAEGRWAKPTSTTIF